MLGVRIGWILLRRLSVVRPTGPITPYGLVYTHRHVQYTTASTPLGCEERNFPDESSMTGLVRTIPLYKEHSLASWVESGMEACKSHLKEAGLEPRIAFIGGGNMTQAIVTGLLKSKILPPESIGVSNPSQPKLETMKAQGVKTYHSKDNKNMIREFASGIIVLSVKPHILTTVLTNNRSAILESKIVLSLAAGVSIDALLSMLEDPRNETGLPIVRVMPTVAAVVRSSPTGIVRNKFVTDPMAVVVRCLLETVGTYHEVPEYQLDALNGLIAPGHAFTIMDAMSDGAVKMGLPRDLALRLSAETLIGAAKLMLETGKHPGELKNTVCSPGGTTIAGIHALEAGGIRAAIINGIEASVLRSRELNELSKKKP